MLEYHWTESDFESQYTASFNLELSSSKKFQTETLSLLWKKISCDVCNVCWSNQTV